MFFTYLTNQLFFLFLSAQVRPSITEEEVYFLQYILAIPLACRSWKGPALSLSKDLNPKARLQNGKVLGTHFAQTKSGLLDSCDLCILFMHAMNDVLNM